MTPCDFDKREGQSEAGRLWDVLWMATRNASQGGPEIRYKIIVRTGGKSKYVELKAICGPGDTAEPVVTIMFPQEEAGAARHADRRPSCPATAEVSA